MDATRSVPKTASGIVASLERHVLGTAAVTAAQQ
jgi:hypothetical protein